MKNAITVSTTVNAPIDKVWEYWNEPNHIMNWAFASDDWEAPFSENDLCVGGRFKTTMSSKDKKESFDFTGVYTNINEKKLIEYDIDKAVNENKPRHVKIMFEDTLEGVHITETFDPENINSQDLQRSGWQAILDNFKKHVEDSSE